MAQAVISGYYGLNNVGDEAILLAIKEAVQSHDPKLSLTVLSANPEQTAEQHDIKAMRRTDLWGIWQALRHANLLISGGGSLLQDRTSHRSLRYYLGVMTMAKLAGCPFMLYAQGIGPIENKVNRWLTGQVVNQAALVTVRDAASAEELRRLGVRQPPIHVTADPVVALSPSPAPVGREILTQAGVDAAGRGPLVGISVRSWKGRETFTTETAQALDRLVEDKDARLVFIPMHFPEDLEMTNALRRAMVHGDETKVLSQRYQAQDLMSAVGHLDLLVAVRLHALIFAAVMNVPAVAISYDPKVDRFAESAGQPLAGMMEDFRGENLYRTISAVLGDRAAIKERLAQTMAKQRGAALENARLALEQIRGR